MTTANVWMWLLALLLIIKGAGVLAQKGKLLEWKKKMLYDRPTAIALWSVAVAWTLWEVTKLGPADFGSFKELLFGIFLALGVSSVWMLKDYLLVRAACVLWLFISWWMLKAVYLQPVAGKELFVGTVYVGIVAALYFAVAPWRARDLLELMTKKPRLRVAAGWAYVGWGLVLVAVALVGRA